MERIKRNEQTTERDPKEQNRKNEIEQEGNNGAKKME